MAHLFAPDRRETPDFVLRSYVPGDGALLRESVSASFEHLRTFMLWARADESPVRWERRARLFRARYITGKDFAVGVFAPDGSRLLGGTGFHLRDGGLRDRNADIGMWVRVDEAGRGLGTRILVEMLRWGFDEWPWERLTWQASAANPASVRVAQKAGMTPDGTRRSNRVDPDGVRRDTLCLAAFRGEWSPPA